MMVVLQYTCSTAPITILQMSHFVTLIFVSIKAGMQEGAGSRCGGLAHGPVLKPCPRQWPCGPANNN
jgi:hypothetical protein